MHEQIRKINERYKDGTSGMEATFQINELAKACVSISKRKETVSPEEFKPITVIMHTEDGYDMKLVLKPLSMALHFQMYDRAEEILSAMEDYLSAWDFKGELHIRPSGNREGTEYGSCKFLITLGQIIISDCDIPEKFLKLYHEKVKLSETLGPPISFAEDINHNSYISNFYVREFDNDRSYNLLTKGLRNIRGKCPELLKDMLFQRNPFLIDTEMPGITTGYTAQEGKRLLKSYTGYVKTVIESCCECGANIGDFLSKLDTVKVRKDFDFVTYEAEYKAYVKMLISCKDMILNSGQENARLELVIHLMKNDASMYVIWTNRHDEHELAVKKSVKNIAAGLGRTVREVIGEDIAWFLEAYDLHMKTFNDFLQILTLLKYSCGYDLLLDLADTRVSTFFRKRFNRIQAGDDMDRQISSAVGALELMAGFQNADIVFDPEPEKELPEEEKADKEKSNKEKALDDLKVIARNLAKLGNEELLEVCLRKNMIPETRYEWMIKKCRRQSVALLPCLIAYKNQLKAAN